MAGLSVFRPLRSFILFQAVVLPPVVLAAIGMIAAVHIPATAAKVWVAALDGNIFTAFTPTLGRERISCLAAAQLHLPGGERKTNHKILGKVSAASFIRVLFTRIFHAEFRRVL